jgi:UDP-N-acetylmuramoylalanine--D-glutamate ligase
VNEAITIHNQKLPLQGTGMRFTILGAGESGVGAAYLALQQGYDVFVSDFGPIADHYKQQLKDWNVKFEENGHTEDEILKAAEVVKSPGIPDKAPIVKMLVENAIPVISEIEFAGRYTDAKMICITGSTVKLLPPALLIISLKTEALT